MNLARGDTSGQLEASQLAIDGIFLVGMFASGVELLGGALSRLGLRALCDTDHPRFQELAAFNDRLLAAWGDPPDAAPVELSRALGARSAGEARERLTATLTQDRAGTPGDPWVWADWRLSFLAPFWSDATGLRPAVILVHREPGQVATADVPRTAHRTNVLDWWDRSNRSALAVCSRFPSLVVNYSDVVSRPKAVLTDIVEFLGDLGIVVDGDMTQAIQYLEEFGQEQDVEESEPPGIDARHLTLDRLLNWLDGRTGDQFKGGGDPRELVEVTAEFYDEDYYGSGYDKGGVPYSRAESVWVDFFTTIAASLVKTLQPATVLDVGCASGMLVEALRSRGVDARGIDISTWAIEQIPADVRPFCRVGSVTEEIDGHYDLVTCIEVLEHLPPTLAQVSVGNMCRHAEMVLFSSTPDDFDEPTHLNVEPSDYWAGLFLRHGFVRDFEYDASFLAPHAILFRRRQADAASLVEGYERTLSRISMDLNARLHEAVREHDRLANRYNQLADTRNSLQISSDEARADRDQLQGDVNRLSEALDNTQRRRAAENAAAFEMVHQFELSQRHLAGHLAARDAEIAALLNTKTFRYSTKLRGLYGRLRRRKVVVEAGDPTMHPPDGTYQMWIDLYDTRDDAARRRIESQVRALAHRPKISVIMPVYNTPVDLLRSAIDSVRHQIYPEWELCIADDCSTDTPMVQLLTEYAASDPRIKVVRREENGHISAASNTALSVATGQWVAPLDHDDLLSEHALALVAMGISEHPGVGLIYSDEDKLDEAGQRRDPFFKPDFDPLLLAGQNYISHLSVFRKDLVDRVGGYREGYEGSQDWDLTLRVSETLTPDQVLHIPHVLYHWRAHRDSTASLVSAKPYAIEAGRHAVRDHMKRTGRSAQVIRMGRLGHNRVRWELPEPAPRVSIVIPTRDGRFLQRCIDSVLDFTMYPNFEVVVVDNSSRTYATLSWLEGHDDRLTVLRDERPFNYAAINNYAVTRTSGDLVCLLNDDTEVISGEWLTEMVSQLIQPGVGAVGAKLYYDDGRIQHAGVVLGIGGVAGHAHRMTDRVSMGYFGNLQLAHRMSAVTAACIVVRREAWDQVGGLDEENLPIAFNDVDFCLRLREAGWEIVWTPHAQLLHHESISRGPDDQGPPRRGIRP